MMFIAAALTLFGIVLLEKSEDFNSKLAKIATAVIVVSGITFMSAVIALMLGDFR